MLVGLTALGAPVAQAADSSGSSDAPEPAAAQLTPPVSGGKVGGSAGLYAVGGGLVMVAGGATLWVKRKRAGQVTIH
ncbi:hypothetical protein [Kitasatospora sp. HPMI-4]|uniref:hypothetical protein n=1 Tax=Kitasatospora sp. HPMI-4 TaxID=3448443 RepID=UPI003F1DA8D1